jgi:hypothetical protein
MAGMKRTGPSRHPADGAFHSEVISNGAWTNHSLPIHDG